MTASNSENKEEEQNKLLGVYKLGYALFG